MLEKEHHSHLHYVEERWDSKNIRVREGGQKKTQMMVAERKSKSENRKLRSMQRATEAKFAYERISRITSTRKLRTVGDSQKKKITDR